MSRYVESKKSFIIRILRFVVISSLLWSCARGYFHMVVLAAGGKASTSEAAGEEFISRYSRSWGSLSSIIAEQRRDEELRLMSALAAESPAGKKKTYSRVANRLEVLPITSSQIAPFLQKGLPGPLSAVYAQRITAYTSGRSARVVSGGGDISPQPKRALRVLLQGGVHGNEQLGRLLVASEALRFQKGQGKLAELKRLGIADFDFLPVVNPDGARLGQRKNGYGVDINRNFPILWNILPGRDSYYNSNENPGVSAASEPETRAEMSLLSAQRYDIALDFHGYSDQIVLPGSPRDVDIYQRPVTDGERVRYAMWARQLHRHSALLADQRRLVFTPIRSIVASSQLRESGSFEDYAFWQLGTLAACIEISEDDNNDWESERQNIIARYEGFIAQLIEGVLAEEEKHSSLAATSQGKAAQRDDNSAFELPAIIGTPHQPGQ